MGDGIPYCGVGPGPQDWLSRWNLDPWLLAGIGLLFTALLAWRGGKVGLGRPTLVLALLALVFVSPLCALSSALFSVRTVHHLLLVAIAAPVLAACLPPTRGRGLMASTLISAAVFWAWHAPPAYATALSHDGVYWLMQISLLGSAVWFWSEVRSANAPAAVAALLVATVQMGLLGALLTFADRAFYTPHFMTTAAWGMVPLQDQQAAGLIMWVPAAALYLGCAIVRLGKWIGPDPVVRSPAT